MTEPARDDAPAPGPRAQHPVGRIDPISSGWANVRGLLITAAEGAQLAVTELAGRPDCPAALRRAELLSAALHDLTKITLRCVIDEQILESERQLAYKQGVADGKAARCNLEVILGGR